MTPRGRSFASRGRFTPMLIQFELQLLELFLNKYSLSCLISHLKFFILFLGVLPKLCKI